MYQSKKTLKNQSSFEIKENQKVNHGGDSNYLYLLCFGDISLNSWYQGDWFCPDCNHKKLLSSLTDKLSELDTLLKKTEAERRRKERLAFINKSLSKTLPSAQKSEVANKKEPAISSDEESESSDTDSEDEVLLPRKCRTKNPVKYNTEEYDQLMNKALLGKLDLNAQL